MNRWLWIPCVVSCLGFVCATSFNVENRAGTNYRSSTSAEPGSLGNESEVLMTATQIKDDLAAKWEHYNRARNEFSRVYRPERRYRRMDIVIDETNPAPEPSMVGILELWKAPDNLTLALAIGNSQLNTEKPADITSSVPDSSVKYPFVVDRRSGNTLVFVADSWRDFNEWAVAGEE